MQPRIYTYRVTFEEIPHWYWGIHKEKTYNDGYLGSPVTHKWMWKFYTPKIQILELFPYSEEGWSEAIDVERRLIVPDLNNPLCLNERVGAIRSWDVQKKACKRGGETVKRDKKGLYGRTPEQLLLDNRKGAAVTNSQKWMSTVDGFVSTSGNVAQHNRRNGWDPAARVKIDNGFTGGTL